jgi:hypothetical protein
MRSDENEAMRIAHRARLLMAIAVISLGTHQAVGQSGSQTVPPAAHAESDPLQLVLIQETSQPRFRVELHNAGNRPLTLKLGFMLANGEIYYPDAIHLVVTDSHGSVLHLDLKGPPFPFATRIDPMIVPLPAGATFSLPTSSGDWKAT